jgi:hypothetical protein
MHSKPEKATQEILNRRYKKLEELLKSDSDYFEAEEIKVRAPLLYNLYIGRFKKNEGSNLMDFQSLSATLFHLMDLSEDRRTLEVAFEKYKADAGEDYFSNAREEEELEEEQLTPLQMEENEDELLRIMHKRFLHGDDWQFFDYSQVDHNSDYDDYALIYQIQEDKYFQDEQESLTIQNISHSPSSSQIEHSEQSQSDLKLSRYTGVQDY